MAKPFKNLTAPASNVNESKKAPLISPEWPPNAGEDRSTNGEPVNAGLEQDGEKPLVWPAVDNGTKPMKLKGG
jgi:hypothetical protein